MSRRVTSAHSQLGSACNLGGMSTSAAAPADGGTFQSLDDSHVTKAQLKIMFISGMGFFTDAYDLFVIGIVVALLKPEWDLSTSQVSLAELVHPARLGRRRARVRAVADMLGRKRIYGYEVLILAIGAIASAFAPNYVFLLVCRIILGIGIGGDYPVSRHDHERVLGQARPRQDGRARLRHAGRRPHLRAAVRLRPAVRPVWPMTPSGGFCSPSAPCPAWPSSTCAAASTRRRGSRWRAGRRRGRRRPSSTPPGPSARRPVRARVEGAHRA